MPNFGDFQLEFYFRGLSGVRESLPFSFAELERQAHAALSEEMVSYIAGGAGNEHTQNANVSAFDRWGIVPRMLVGAAQRDLSVNLFGHRLATPLLLAPIGVIGLCTPDGHGDLATAKAAAVAGVPMIASTLSADPMEVVAKEFGDTPGFFQLYPPNDRELTESFIHRARSCGLCRNRHYSRHLDSRLAAARFAARKHSISARPLSCELRVRSGVPSDAR